MKLPLLPAGLLAICACSGPVSDTPLNVILICLDTVRADHLGCYGYEKRPTTPALDALAQRAVLFRDTSATACWTKPSVPSILTGMLPAQHGVYRGSARQKQGSVSDSLPGNALTLAEIFRSQDYATAAFVRNAQLRKGLGFEQGFDSYRDDAGDAREIRWRTRDWLEDREPEQPFFLYLHFLDAHWPYPVPEEYAGRFTDAEYAKRFQDKDWRAERDAINDGRLVLTGEEREALIALYDGSIRFIDDELGRLFEFLEREGLSENTVIAVVSDHGEEFLEHGRIGHGHGLYENLLSVPWILAVPGERGRVVDTPASLVDVFPTLLTAANVTVPAGALTQSRGVDRLRTPDLAQPLFAEHLEPDEYTQSLRREKEKLVRSFESGRAPPPKPSIELGTRWEARVEATADAGLRAVRLAVRKEPPSEPTEIKGGVEAPLEASFELHGITVLISDATSFYGETGGASRPTLAPGSMVKARGGLSADGDFVAERIKLYAADEEVDQEIRGAVTGTEEGRVAIGGIWVTWDTRTKFRTGMEALEAITREALAAHFTDGLGDLKTSCRIFDLSRDPAELGVLEAAESKRLEAALDPLSRSLFESRMWGAGDRQQLSDEDLTALRAIGYAE